jgi:hypothetical protein
VYGVPAKYEALCVCRVLENFEELHMCKVPVKVPFYNGAQHTKIMTSIT